MSSSPLLSAAISGPSSVGYWLGACRRLANDGSWLGRHAVLLKERRHRALIRWLALLQVGGLDVRF
jgi:hypothetical protein